MDKIQQIQSMAKFEEMKIQTDLLIEQIVMRLDSVQKNMDIALKNLTYTKEVLGKMISTKQEELPL